MNNTFEDLEILVAQWAYDKGILEKSSPRKQLQKTLEEIGELVGADTEEEERDAVGDTLVTLIIFCAMRGYNIVDCLEDAYGIISKRKGEMINGLFVKNDQG